MVSIDKKNCTTKISKNFSNNKHQYFNSVKSQQARLLQHFEMCPRLTTMEARSKLGVLHPAGRVQELRLRGYRIDTTWTYQVDTNNVEHRIGLYIYRGQEQANG